MKGTLSLCLAMMGRVRCKYKSVFGYWHLCIKGTYKYKYRSVEYCRGPPRSALVYSCLPYPLDSVDEKGALGGLCPRRRSPSSSAGPSSSSSSSSSPLALQLLQGKIGHMAAVQRLWNDRGKSSSSKVEQLGLAIHGGVVRPVRNLSANAVCPQKKSMRALFLRQEMVFIALTGAYLYNVYSIYRTD